MNPENISEESKVLGNIALMLLQRDFKGAMEIASELRVIWIDCQPCAVCSSPFVVKEK